MSTGSTAKGRAATNIGTENKRIADISSIGQPGMAGGVRIAYATITKVDAEKALIKANEIGTNSPIGSGRWIPLSHSVKEIAERWGKLRKGFTVLVQYTGPDGSNSVATIIKDEYDHITDTDREENTMSQGCYRIFAPGSFPS